MGVSMVIHYHGSPIWGDCGEVCKIAVNSAGSFVSFARPDQLELSLRNADCVAIDNGAFSAWKRGLQIDWTDFYSWLMRFYHHHKLSFFVIPDVVEGGEDDNDKLIRELPTMFRAKAAPVWHLHESIDRLVALCEQWPRVCFGSSGEYAVIRTKAWHQRMIEAFTEIYAKRGLRTKIHGLRMLDGRVLGNYPLATADSTNLACNVPKFEVKYPELTRTIRDADYAQGLTPDELKRLILRRRCAILKGAIEQVRPPTIDEWINNPLRRVYL
ncbi:hypothetical protein MLT67_12250 [Escherichia coli]|uniref:hypothetical protein n=1 Tax=Escherichia fergusonii TaxID=564 RepID=UPI0020174DF7|nr:hypothetical protein [Escherichia fergusonii]MBI1074410.1 hypothetical protein [Escherichia coli]MCN2350116.1 hypothetical protein [Escherichia coli]MCN2497802.1 hypothetical protein [Escherichia coli]